MKRLMIPMLAMLFISLTGCSVSAPMKVAKKYLKALESNEKDKARSLVSPSSLETFDSLFGGDKKILTKYEILREEITGDTAYIYYREKGTTAENKLQMKNIDGVWKVVLFTSSGK